MHFVNFHAFNTGVVFAILYLFIYKCEHYFNIPSLPLSLLLICPYATHKYVGICIHENILNILSSGRQFVTVGSKALYCYHISKDNSNMSCVHSLSKGRLHLNHSGLKLRCSGQTWPTPWLVFVLVSCVVGKSVSIALPMQDNLILSSMQKGSKYKYAVHVLRLTLIYRENGFNPTAVDTLQPVI